MSTPIISIICAAAQNRVIGRNNSLPWRLPTDLNFFRETTAGKPVVMGHKTFSSIGRPLPGRKNVVITRNPTAVMMPNIIRPPQWCLAESIEEALVKAAQGNPDEIFIIGGADIYKQALELGLVHRVYLTDVDLEPEGDTFFPILDTRIWALTKEGGWEQGAQDECRFRFLVFDKIPS